MNLKLSTSFTYRLSLGTGTVKTYLAENYNPLTGTLPTDTEWSEVYQQDFVAQNRGILLKDMAKQFKATLIDFDPVNNCGRFHKQWISRKFQKVEEEYYYNDADGEIRDGVKTRTVVTETVQHDQTIYFRIDSRS